MKCVKSKVHASDWTVRTSLRRAACDLGLERTVTVVDVDASPAIECDIGRMRVSERWNADDVDGRPTLSVLLEKDTRVTPLKQQDRNWSNNEIPFRFRRR